MNYFQAREIAQKNVQSIVVNDNPYYKESVKCHFDENRRVFSTEDWKSLAKIAKAFSITLDEHTEFGFKPNNVEKFIEALSSEKAEYRSTGLSYMISE